MPYAGRMLRGPPEFISMTISPRISIIMAAYNAEPHIEPALDSLTRQTFDEPKSFFASAPSMLGLSGDALSPRPARSLAAHEPGTLVFSKCDRVFRRERGQGPACVSSYRQRNGK